MTSSLRTCLFALVGLLHGTLLGQPVCSINIGPDQSICQGEQVTLFGPPGYTNYLWSNGATTQNITVSTAGSYWCQVSYPTGNMVVNGDFSAGNTGFNSAFTWSNDLYAEGHYYIGTNANAFHSQWQGVSNGAFLMLNGGFNTQWSAFYCLNLNVCPGQTYTMSWRMASLATSGPPEMQWIVSDGTAFGNVTASNNQGQWTTFTANWTATTSATNLDFCMQQLSGFGVGNDIGLDNISFAGTIILRDTVQVTVNPLPVMNCGSYGPVCADAPSLSLNGSPVGGTWSGPGVVGNTFSPTVAGPGTHDVTYAYTDGNGCSNSCTTSIVVHPLPVANCGSPGPFCVNDATQPLGGTPAGGTWSGPGVSGNSFDPAAAGSGAHAITYTYTDANGCVDDCTANVVVHTAPVLDCGSYGPYCVYQPSIPLGGTPAGGTWSGPGVSAGQFSPGVAGSSTHTLTYTYTDPNGCTFSCTTDVVVNPMPIVVCDPAGPLCISAPPIALSAQPAGGNWSGAGVAGGSFDPGAAGTGDHALTYIYTDANGCSSSCITTVTVNPTPVVACGSYGPACADASPLPLNGLPTGGTWSGTGIVGSTFDPTVSGPGTHTVTYQFTDANGCSASCSTDIVVNPLPAVACGNYGPLCPGAPAIALNGIPAGGTWSGTGIVGSTFDPAASGPGAFAVTYTFTDANGCSAACTTTINVDPVSALVCGTYGPACQSAAPIALAGAPAGGTWSGPGVVGSTLDPALAGPGTHTLTYTFTTANGCVHSCQTDVVVHPDPVAVCGAYGPFCADDAAVALGGAPAGGTWSGPGVVAGNFDPTLAGAATHALQYDVTDANGCSASCTVDVVVHPLPQVDAGTAQVLCANAAPYALVGSPLGGTWSGPGVSSGTFDPAAVASGPHLLTYAFTDANGCSATDNVLFTVNPMPTVDLGGDQTVCPGDAATFNATTPGATYLWQDGSTLPTFTTDQPGTVSVTVTVGGCSSTSSAELINFSLASVDLGPDQTGCAGTPIPLSVNIGGATFVWSTGATTSTINAAASGWYWVDATLNGCAARDSIFIDLLPLPTVNLGLDRMVCPGATALLNATTPGASYLWSDGSTTATVQAGPGTWSVTVTVNGCSASDVVNVGTWTPPSIDLGEDTLLCPGQSVTLNATTPFVTYLWQDGSQAATFLVQQGGTYSVTLTDTHGCTASDAVDVTYVNVTTVDLGPDTTICTGSNLLLDATTAGATFYQWNNGYNDPTLPVSGGGLYWVDVTQNGCLVSDSITVTMQPLPDVQLGNDTTLCPGNTLVLDATVAGDTYVWQDGATTATYTVTGPGTYHVAVTDAVHCTGHDTIVVAYASPDALDLGPDTAICAGTSLTLDATLPGSSYLWSTGATTSSIQVSTPGLYSVNVLQGACPLTDAITVDVLPAPVVDLGADTVLCDGATLVLDAGNPGATFLWTNGSTAQTVVVSSPGVISVDVDLNGCVLTDVVDVQYVGPLVFDLGADTTLCPDATILLTAQLPGGSTVWSTNQNGPQITVATGGTYWANINVQGCVATDSITIAYVDLAPVELGDDADLCTGSSIVLDITQAGASYLWEDGSTEPTRTIDQAGTYWARVVLAGCEVSDTVQVTLLPLPVVALGADTGLCAAASLLLNATQPGATYLWSDGSTTPTLVVGPGDWDVAVTVNGCTASDAIAVSALATPDVDLPEDTTLCTGAIWLADAAEPGATYLWQDGSTLSGFTVEEAGTYAVTVTIGTCSITEEVTVAYFDAAAVDLGPDTALCPGAELVLQLQLPGVSLTWPDGSNGSSYTVTTAGTYTVLADANGCTTSDAIVVSYVPLVTPDLGDDRTLCAGDSLVLTVVPGGASVLWSTGSVVDSTLVTSGGQVQVTLTLDGCSASDAVNVVFLPRVESIDLGPDATICPGRDLVLDATTHLAEYTWNTGSDRPTLAVTMPGTYIVELAGPCINATDTITITTGDCAPLIHVPNAFTPNGDGMNEVFLPVVSGAFDAYELLIFDRWGEAIFSSASPQGSWDGLVNGTPAQDGVYVWTIRYKAVTDEGVVQERLTGHVTLLR